MPDHADTPQVSQIATLPAPATSGATRPGSSLSVTRHNIRSRAFDLDEYVYAALRAGASGFLLKDTPPADLLAAIRIVAAGDALLAPAVTRRLIAEFARRPEPGRAPAGTLDGVTDRERGPDPDRPWPVQRGDRAGPARHDGHCQNPVGRLLAKLGARDRAQLVMVAYETGLVRPGLERAGGALSRLACPNVTLTAMPPSVPGSSKRSAP